MERYMYFTSYINKAYLNEGKQCAISCVQCVIFKEHVEPN